MVLEHNQICGLALSPVGGNDAGRDWTLLLDEDPSSRPDAPRRGSVPEQDLLEWGVCVFLMLCDGILGRIEHQLISQPVPLLSSGQIDALHRPDTGLIAQWSGLS